MRFTTTCSALLLALGLLSIAAPAQAAPITWDIDSSASYVRLTIADQTLSIDGTTATIRIRDANNNAWSDAGGRKATLDGTIQGTFTPGSEISFTSGAHNIDAIAFGSFRPNPAAFNPGATNADNPDGTYSNTSGAPADFAAKVRASISILTVDAAFIAFRDVLFDIASGSLAVDGAGNFGSGSTFGIKTANLDVDGLNITLVGQVIPDMLNSPLNNLLGTNTSGGSVTDLGGNLYRLVYNITVPIALDLDGTLINASAAGQIVAYGILVPEPSTMVLAGFAAFGLAWAGRRRFRRS